MGSVSYCVRVCGHERPKGQGSPAPDEIVQDRCNKIGDILASTRCICNELKKAQPAQWEDVDAEVPLRRSHDAQTNIQRMTNIASSVSKCST